MITFTVNVAAVRAAWAQDGEQAATEIAGARAKVTAAKGSVLGDLQQGMNEAADHLGGVLGVVGAVITELGTNIESCLAEYVRTHHQSAGRFHGLS